MITVQNTDKLQLIFEKYKDSKVEFTYDDNQYKMITYKYYTLTPDQQVVKDIETDIKNLGFDQVDFVPPGYAAISNYVTSRVRVWFKEENGSVVIDSIIAG